LNYLDKVKQLKEKWDSPSVDNTRVGCELSELSEKSTYQPTSESEKVLNRLRAGTEWLTAQHKAWINDQPEAATDERFSTALEGWDLLERKLRQEFGYEGCIFGPAQHCPADSPVTCDACAGVRDDLVL
jgi:hypothetical protein